ncbi:MAG: cytochrome-c peroxidase [Bryobacteraceae bacterium]
MPRVRIAIAFAVVAVLVAGIGCGRRAEESQTIDPARLQMFAPLPSEVPPPSGSLTQQQINLGRMLYYETRLSTDQKISCNTCHQLDKYGVDGQPTSDGHKGQRGTRNSPTVYNAAGHVAQFWDGRAPTVEEQAKGPVTNPVEMAMPSEKVVVAVLKSMPEYVQAFKAAFPTDKDPVTFENMARAIGAFERKLITPSRWDKFLTGDQSALTPAEKEGFNAFVNAGCQTCHSGALLGATMYQKLGVIKPYPDEEDLGRFQLTKSDGDKMVFKVPSLRNIEKTGPYFHNGKVGTLEEAVTRMGEYQVGRKLSSGEIQSIVTWLKSLTGEIPADYIKPPALPASTGKTPKPEAAG